jgi:SPP1 family predicted phage head-tail adaptor
MIARLCHRVILQRRSEVADLGGGVNLSWTDIAELWAGIMPLTGSETVRAMRVQPIQNFLIRLRYRDDITAADRLLFGQRVLNIRSVRNVNERGQWLECRCEEGVGG